MSPSAAFRKYGRPPFPYTILHQNWVIEVWTVTRSESMIEPEGPWYEYNLTGEGMRPGSAPIGEQLAILIVGPPLMASLIWLMSRGWATSVQGGAASEKTKRRQKLEFWVVLIVMYVIGFSMAFYAWLT